MDPLHDSDIESIDGGVRLEGYESNKQEEDEGRGEMFDLFDPVDVQHHQHSLEIAYRFVPGYTPKLKAKMDQINAFKPTFALTKEKEHRFFIYPGSVSVQDVVTFIESIESVSEGVGVARYAFAMLQDGGRSAQEVFSNILLSRRMWPKEVQEIMPKERIIENARFGLHWLHIAGGDTAEAPLVKVDTNKYRKEQFFHWLYDYKDFYCAKAAAKIPELYPMLEREFQTNTCQQLFQQYERDMSKQKTSEAIDNGEHIPKGPGIDDALIDPALRASDSSAQQLEVSNPILKSTPPRKASRAKGTNSRTVQLPDGRVLFDELDDKARKILSTINAAPTRKQYKSTTQVPNKAWLKTKLPEEFRQNSNRHGGLRSDSHLHNFTLNALQMSHEVWNYICGDNEQDANFIKAPAIYNAKGGIRQRERPNVVQPRGQDGKMLKSDLQEREDLFDRGGVNSHFSADLFGHLAKEYPDQVKQGDGTTRGRMSKRVKRAVDHLGTMSQNSKNVFSEASNMRKAFVRVTKGYKKELGSCKQALDLMKAENEALRQELSSLGHQSAVPHTEAPDSQLKKKDEEMLEEMEAIVEQDTEVNKEVQFEDDS